MGRVMEERTRDQHCHPTFWRGREEKGSVTSVTWSGWEERER